jgi:trigger factor
VLIERELDDMAADFEGRLKQQGFTLDRYLEMSKKTADEVRADRRAAARERVRRALVFGEFARVEGLDTTAAEVDAEIERIVSIQGDAAARVRAILAKPEQREGVENRLLSRKIADRLFASATGADESAADMEPTATDESPAAS